MVANDHRLRKAAAVARIFFTGEHGSKDKKGLLTPVLRMQDRM
jgi:hypothetical protein